MNERLAAAAVLALAQAGCYCGHILATQDTPRAASDALWLIPDGAVIGGSVTGAVLVKNDGAKAAFVTAAAIWGAGVLLGVLVRKKGDPMPNMMRRPTRTAER